MSRAGPRAWLAAAASFAFPGLGQLVGGRFKRAGAVLLAQSALDPLIIAGFVFLPFGVVGLALPIVALLVWRLWAARDAFLVNRSPRDQRATRSPVVWVGAVLVFVLAAVALRVPADLARTRYVGAAFKIPAESMAPALLTGDYLLVRPLPERTIRRREVVAFTWPADTTKTFMKRVVGVPGDTLAMREGVLVVNGRRQQEDYVQLTDAESDPSGEELLWQREALAADPRQRATYRPSRDNWGPLVVPDDAYFVLGDNRHNSLDSRYWGFVRADHLSGRAWRIYFSRDPRTGRVRWARIGRLVHGGN